MGGQSEGGMGGRNWGIVREEWLFLKATHEIKVKGEKDAFNAEDRALNRSGRSGRVVKGKEKCFISDAANHLWAHHHVLKITRGPG